VVASFIQALGQESQLIRHQLCVVQAEKHEELQKNGRERSQSIPELSQLVALAESLGQMQNILDSQLVAAHLVIATGRLGAVTQSQLA